MIKHPITLYCDHHHHHHQLFASMFCKFSFFLPVGQMFTHTLVVLIYHFFLFPTKADGRVTDLNTNRARYSNPYVLGDWVGWANQHAKKFVATWGAGVDPEEAKVLQTIGRLNLEQKTSAFSKFGCKNEGFVTAMVSHRHVVT